MRTRFPLLLALAVICLVTTASATGTVTRTVTPTANIAGQATGQLVTVTWTSSAGGAVTGNAFSIAGQLYQVKVVPDGGATQPTDLFDLTIVDADAASLLVIDSVDYGANLSNAAPKVITIDPPIGVYGSTTLDVRIANAGDAKGGKVLLYFH